MKKSKQGRQKPPGLTHSHREHHAVSSQELLVCMQRLLQSQVRHWDFFFQAVKIQDLTIVDILQSWTAALYCSDPPSPFIRTQTFYIFEAVFTMRLQSMS